MYCAVSIAEIPVPGMRPKGATASLKVRIQGIVNIPLTSKDLSSVAAQAWLDLTKPMGQRGELVPGGPGGANAWIWPQAAFDLHEAGQDMDWPNWAYGFCQMWQGC